MPAPLTVVDLTEQLIRQQSVTPDDAGCQPLMVAQLDKLGFAAESMRFGETDNLWLRRGTSGPVLCFAGHTDVVPAGPLSDWASNPFDPVMKDGFLYGRGAADMKGSLAAMIIAAREFVTAHADHHGSLAFLITSDEEGRARDGTKRVIETLVGRGEKIDWCVVGEPSSQTHLGDMIRIGRRGSLSGMLHVHGIQGHVAYPQLADNPILKFAPALAALGNKQWDDGNAAFPPTSFQVVEIKAGVGAPNVIPGELYVRFNFRYCTEWDHTELRSEVEAMLDSFNLNYSLDWHLSGAPFLTEKPELIDAVVAATEKVCARTPVQSTGGGTSDGRFIAPAGVEVVELGPVNASIHKVNEHVRVADLNQLKDVYFEIMKRLLVD